MNTYLFGDQTIQSAVKFKALACHLGTLGISAFIKVNLRPPKEPMPYDWQHEWKESNDSITLSVALHKDGFLLRFPELCDFILDPDQRIIHIIPHEALDENTIEHLLVDQVLPRFLANEGHLLLHACAVDIQGRTVLFLGKSGWGKSTLAALLHQAGHTLYSDDCVLLQPHDSNWQATATYPSLRLYEDSIESIFIENYSLSPVSEYSDKHRIAMSTEPAQDAPLLHAMYFLSDPETATHHIQITQMQPANTCIELIERSFRLDLGNHKHTRELMQSAAALTKNVPAYRLSYPHDFKNNSRLLAQIIQHVQQ